MTTGPASDPARERDERQPAARAPSPAEPALPQRSADDSDIGWGGHPDADDDERLRQDRPPHWDSP